SSPYSLDVFEGHLYWTSKERGEVWKKDKFGNGEKVKLLTINPWLTQVRVYHQHRCNQSVSNPCKDVCSHLCLLRPGGYTCACPQGARFVEGSSVECDAAIESPPTMPPACRCLYGGTCYFDESELPKCKYVFVDGARKTLTSQITCGDGIVYVAAPDLRRPKTKSKPRSSKPEQDQNWTLQGQKPGSEAGGKPRPRPLLPGCPDPPSYCRMHQAQIKYGPETGRKQAEDEPKTAARPPGRPSPGHTGAADGQRPGPGRDLPRSSESKRGQSWTLQAES
ncbi:uncharacterized protein LOC107300334, partial [Protobothrops mucrosquamatus]|uniref:uncharacterized protein LOC107300334 n=1 Tax=Protobothrops mucrosquamatus TaxID=103944 RepID=UPI0007758A7F